MSNNLSVALAVFNEEENLGECLKSVASIADEIVIVDGGSSDKTLEIAKGFRAKIIQTDNPPMFHINKMKAVNASSSKWILQLDADERVSNDLADEIRKLIKMDENELDTYQQSHEKAELFSRHIDVIEKRDGPTGTKNGEYAAFFIPRLNYFLGRYLRHGGVYPDGVIRLFIKGKAYLPCKDVHEQYIVEGKVGWLKNDLLHYDSPTFKKYIRRNNRYTSLIAKQLKDKKIGLNPISGFDYMVVKPTWWFLLTFVRHKGILDSWQGFVFSFFSALRFPVSYIKYLKNYV